MLKIVEGKRGVAMRIKVAVLPGDGIGPEVTAAAVAVLKTVAGICDHQIEFAEYAIGGAAIREFHTPLPVATLDACLNSHAVLLGAVGAPEFDHLPRGLRPEAGLLQLRAALGGFANLRPAMAHPSLAGCSPLRPELLLGTDLMIVRELLGGLYFNEPRAWDKEAGIAHNTMRYSNDEVERVARVAFEEARRRRKKVTSVDKANVLETSQLWREVVTRVGRDYPDVKLEHMYVDACAMHLVTNPKRFDVIVTENLFGDILSDEAAAIAGSLGMLPSATIGGKVDLYEPVHGSAPDLVGRKLANPLGAIASAAMLLRYTAGLEDEADDIDAAMHSVLSDGYRTQDLRPSSPPYGEYVSTEEMSNLVEEALSNQVMRRQSYHAV
jgi:3-isopropylmalate dehydrogenase